MKTTCYIMLISVIVAWVFGVWWIVDEESMLLLVVSGVAGFLGSACAGLLLWPADDP